MTTRRPRPLRGAIVGFGQRRRPRASAGLAARRQLHDRRGRRCRRARRALAADRLPSAPLRRARRAAAQRAARLRRHRHAAGAARADRPRRAAKRGCTCSARSRSPRGRTSSRRIRERRERGTLRRLHRAQLEVRAALSHAPGAAPSRRHRYRVPHSSRDDPNDTAADAASGGTWRLDPAQAGGGILVDHGWHAFYLARHLADAEPVAISATTSQRKFVTTGVEDTAECSIEFPSARADIVLTWAGDARRNAGTVTGSLGTLTIADDMLVTAIGDRPPVETRFAHALSAGSYHPDWFATMLEDFHLELHDAHLRGENFREAEACCRLLECGYASSASDGARLALAAASPEAPVGASSGA